MSLLGGECRIGRPFHFSMTSSSIPEPMPSPAASLTLSPEDLRAAVPPVAGYALSPGLAAPLTVPRAALAIPHLRPSSCPPRWFAPRCGRDLAWVLSRV